MKLGNMYKGLIFIAILIGALALFAYFLPGSEEYVEIPLNDAIDMSKNYEIAEIVVEEEALLITAVDGSELKTFKEPSVSIYHVEGLNLEGVVVWVKGSTGINWVGLLLNFLPLLVFVGLLFFLFRRVRRMSKVLIIMGILLGFVALFSYLVPSTNKPEEVPLSQVVAMSQNKEITEITVEDNLLLITTVDSTQLRAFKESNATIYEIKGFDLEGIALNIEGSSGINWGNLTLNLLPLIIFGGILFFFFRHFKRFKRGQ